MSLRKLVIISVDALNAKDFNVIKTLPTFAQFLAEGAYVPNVDSVYPTVTYTCHTSIATGHYPHIHGIYNNEYPDPIKPTTQDWRWFERDIKSPTLFDYAKQKGHTVATLLWPVMAGADVEWNIPEIWAPDDSRSNFSLFYQYGTKNLLLPVLFNSHLLKGKQQPQLDNFTEAIATYLLKNKKPDIAAIHFTELDAFRHIHGLDSKESLHSLARLDQRINHLIDATKKAGTYDQTNFVLLGDHGTHNFTKIIEMNSFFKKEHLHEAYACTCGGSCQIHLNKGITEDRTEEIFNKLTQLIDSQESPIKCLFTKEEVYDNYRLKGDFQWVLEAKDGHIFKNTSSGKLVTDRTELPKCYKGDHGYLPTHEDMHTMLLMKGPDIKKAAVLENCSIVDEGPTFAKLMGMTMEKVEGRVLTDLLK